MDNHCDVQRSAQPHEALKAERHHDSEKRRSPALNYVRDAERQRRESGSDNRIVY
jgi:hypothetical protein